MARSVDPILEEQSGLGPHCLPRLVPSKSSNHYGSIGINEPPHDKTYKMACAPSEDSDQSGHPPSLISVFAVRMKKAWVLSYPVSASEDSDQTGRMPRLIWVFAGRTVILLVLSWGGSNMNVLTGTGRFEQPENVQDNRHITEKAASK